MSEFTIKGSRSFECKDDLNNKALMVYLVPNNPDKSGRCLERGEEYKTNGKMLTILAPDIEEGDKINVRVFLGRVLSDEEYRTILCDPQTWYFKSHNLYHTAEAIMIMYHKDLEMFRNGITPTEKPIFSIGMLDTWIFLMAFAIENAAKGIIVYNMIKKDPSLKKKATLNDFNIKGHDIDDYLRRAFKAKNRKMDFMELRFAEDLAAYAEFAGRYKIGSSPGASVPNDIIMQSTPAESFELGYFDTIIGLFKKLDDWLNADMQEAHAEEIETMRESCQRLEEKYGHILKNIGLNMLDITQHDPGDLHRP